VQPNYIIDYLKIPNEFFKSFELNKTDIKRIKTKDNTILIQTHLLIIFNDTLLKTAKDKKNRLSNIFPNEIISIKRLNSIEKFERFKDFKNKDFIEIKTMSCPEIILQKTMDKKSKLISGLKLKLTLPPKERYFSNEEKHFIINEYLNGTQTKRDIWEKYTGQKEEHGRIINWMRKLGYQVNKKTKNSFIFDENQIKEEMKKQLKSEEEFEKLQLEKRIEELEKKLKESEMKSIAYSTMIDIAEKELNISIRKKLNTKPSNK
jgi:adenylate kinase